MKKDAGFRNDDEACLFTDRPEEEAGTTGANENPVSALVLGSGLDLSLMGRGELQSLSLLFCSSICVALCKPAGAMEDEKLKVSFGASSPNGEGEGVVAKEEKVVLDAEGNPVFVDEKGVEEKEGREEEEEKDEEEESGGENEKGNGAAGLKGDVVALPELALRGPREVRMDVLPRPLFSSRDS